MGSEEAQVVTMWLLQALHELRGALLGILLSTNHYLVAEQLIYAAWQEESIDPRLASLLTRYETLALTDRDGAGVGGNLPTERLNAMINSRKHRIN